MSTEPSLTISKISLYIEIVSISDAFVKVVMPSSPF
jgi:hypothetical protein